MAGGISYVLESVHRKIRKSDSKMATSSVYSSKGAYELEVVLHKGRKGTADLRHYGTSILFIDFKKKKVSGGYGSVSSSGAINKTLNFFGIPCWWSFSYKSRGFWCRDGWTGDPSGQKYAKSVSEIAKRNRNLRTKMKQAVRPGGLFRIPGRRYSKLAISKMASLQKELLNRDIADNSPEVFYHGIPSNSVLSENTDDETFAEYEESGNYDTYSRVWDTDVGHEVWRRGKTLAGPYALVPRFALVKYFEQ
jgi:hypothetical protein